jgi:arylformamidase
MLTADWIDVSVPLRTGMVHWPDNTPVSIERMLDIEGGDGAPSRAILRFIEAA